MKTTYLFVLFLISGTLACECIKCDDLFIKNIKTTDHIFIGKVIGVDTGDFNKALPGFATIQIIDRITQTEIKDTVLIMGGFGIDCVVPIKRIKLDSTYLFKGDRIKLRTYKLNACRISFLPVIHGMVQKGERKFNDVYIGISDMKKEIEGELKLNR
jgi:hypothetical protein